jgi:hypothetical protein
MTENTPLTTDPPPDVALNMHSKPFLGLALVRNVMNVIKNPIGLCITRPRKMP